MGSFGTERAPSSRGQLQLQFWQVAEAQRLNGGFTPFEEQRYAWRMSADYVAAQMMMDIDEYRGMERGTIIAQPKDIIAFCHVLKCHPLDLYSPEANADVPLPREILRSLILMVEHDFFTKAQQKRAQDRLDIELKRASSIMLANVQDMEPLLLACGYTPDKTATGLPFYIPDRYATGRKSGDFLSTMLDQGADDKRVFMDNCLMMYQLDLEQEHDLHVEIKKGLQERYDKNKATLRKLAKSLFGADKADRAIEIMCKMQLEPRNLVVFLEGFKKDPAIVMPLWNGAPNDMGSSLNQFFFAAKTHNNLVPAIEKEEADEMVFEAYNRLENFLRWRDSARAATMLDWAESFTLINDLNNAGMQQPKEQPQEKPFPYLPV